MSYKRDDVLDDEEAKRIITELYEKGHGMAAYAIGQVLGNQLSGDEREDLIQEGFLRMVIHVESLRDKTLGQRLSYMYSAMRSVAIDEGRRRTKNKILHSIDSDDYTELPSDELTPEERFMRAAQIEEDRRRLHAVLAKLEARDLSLLIEKYKNGLSDKEIGLKLGIKTGNVRVYMARARRKAAQYYEEVLDEERNGRAGRKTDSKKRPEGLSGISDPGSPV